MGTAQQIKPTSSEKLILRVETLGKSILTIGTNRRRVSHPQQVENRKVFIRRGTTSKLYKLASKDKKLKVCKPLINISSFMAMEFKSQQRQELSTDQILALGDLALS